MHLATRLEVVVLEEQFLEMTDSDVRLFVSISFLMSGHSLCRFHLEAGIKKISTNIVIIAHVSFSSFLLK